MPAKKLVLTYVDSLRTDMLQRAVAEGAAPTFGALLERGALVPDCVSSFPSVTPVACAEIVTGSAADRHWISGMNWYHRLERRYVEYGSSLDATRAFGVFRALYDLVYNMNLAHLSPEVETIFEQLDDAEPANRLHAVPDLPRSPSPPGFARGARAPRRRRRAGSSSATTPGGRRSSSTATSTPAARSPAAPPRSPAAETATRPAARPSWRRTTASTSCSSRCPTTTTTRTATGPKPASSRSARRTTASRKLTEAVRRTRRVPRGVRADPRRRPCPVAGAAGPAAGRVARPRVGRAAALGGPSGAGPARGQPDRPRRPRLSAAGRGSPRADPTAVRRRLAETEGIDLVCWLEDLDGAPLVRHEPGMTDRRRRPPSSSAARRSSALPAGRQGGRPARAGAGRSKATSAPLSAEVEDGALRSDEYPDPLARVYVGADSPQRRRLHRLPLPGYEAVDWGGVSHAGGGSHGALHRGTRSARCSSSAAGPGSRSSGAPVGPARRRAIVLEHFGL